MAMRDIRFMVEAPEGPDALYTRDAQPEAVSLARTKSPEAYRSPECERRLPMESTLTDPVPGSRRKPRVGRARTQGNALRWLLALACLLPQAAVVHATAPPGAAAREIILVRHGNYTEEANVDERIGPGLSPLGVAQARLAGARLAGLPARFDAMLVSPMQRARDTAAIIGEEFPGRHFEVVDDLAECTPPTRRTEITSGEKPADLAACKARLDRVFATYFRPATGREHTDLIVCHGNVIRYLVTRALGVDTTAWLEMSVGHASITRIRVEADGRYKVISTGDVGHIPPALRTGATGDPQRSLAIPALP
jgi:serine/threonine-protein phosphatase PGAM5